MPGIKYEGSEIRFFNGSDETDFSLKIESNKNVTAANNFTIGTSGAGLDYTLTFAGETNTGIMTWMEDYFSLNKGMVLTSGDIGLTGTRVNKVWATDLEVTNAPSLGGTSFNDLYLNVGGDSMGGDLNMAGNSFIGNTTSGGNLSLNSTSNATKGNILLNDATILDTTNNTEAFLVRKSGDSGDIFTVDTNNGRVGIGGVPLNRFSIINAGQNLGFVVGSNIQLKPSTSETLLQTSAVNTRSILNIKGNGTGQARLQLSQGTDANAYIRYEQFASTVQFRIGSTNTTVIYNSTQEDCDFRYRGTTSTQLFCLDMGNNRVGIETAIPAELFDVNGLSRCQTLTVDGDVGSGVAGTNRLTGVTDTPTTDPGWATSSTVNMNTPNGYIKMYVGAQAIVVPYWNT